MDTFAQKISFISLSVLALSALGLSAETYNYTLVNDKDATGADNQYAFLNSDGSAASIGCVTFGYIGIDGWTINSTQTAAEIRDNFVAFPVNSESSTPLPSTNGAFTIYSNFSSQAGAGKTLLAFIGNNSSVQASTQFAVVYFTLPGTDTSYDVPAIFPEEESQEFYLLPDELAESYVRFIAGSSTEWDIQLVAIPEPSMFGVLAGIFALALAGTRRRKRNSAQ